LKLFGNLKMHFFSGRFQKKKKQFDRSQPVAGVATDFQENGKKSTVDSHSVEIDHRKGKRPFRRNSSNIPNFPERSVRGAVPKPGQRRQGAPVSHHTTVDVRAILAPPVSSDLVSAHPTWFRNGSSYCHRNLFCFFYLIFIVFILF